MLISQKVFFRKLIIWERRGNLILRAEVINANLNQGWVSSITPLKKQHNIYLNSCLIIPWLEYLNSCLIIPWLEYLNSCLIIPWLEYLNSCLIIPWLEYLNSCLIIPWLEYTCKCLRYVPDYYYIRFNGKCLK